jgi:hypothetical protein
MFDWEYLFVVECCKRKQSKDKAHGFYAEIKADARC